METASYGRERLPKCDSTSNDLGKSRTKIIDVRFSANVPSSTDKASVFVDTVSAEWEAPSVDRLRMKKVRRSLPPRNRLTSGTIRELEYPPDEGK